MHFGFLGSYRARAEGRQELFGHVSMAYGISLESNPAVLIPTVVHLRLDERLVVPDMRCAHI